MNEIFGKRFKQLRLSLDLKQQELVDDFNKKYNYSFNRVAISQYENGKRIPEIDALTSFADYFGVTVDYLLGRTDERSIQKEKPKLDPGIKTIAAHRINPHDDISDEGIDQINKFIEFIRMQEQNK